MLKVSDSRCVFLVLHGDTEPDVSWQELPAVDFLVDESIILSCPPHHPFRALRQELEYVMVGLDHDIEDPPDELVGHALMEEVGHGVHEDHLRLFPSERQLKPFGPEPQIEPLFKRMSRHTAKPLGKRLRIAMFAPGTDFRAAGDRIPGRVGPFDMRLKTHSDFESSSSN